MALEVAGERLTLVCGPSDTEVLKQVSSRFLREMRELPLRRGCAPERVEIGDLLQRGNDTEPAIARRQAAQQRLERRLAQLTRLRILQRLQTVEDQQRPVLRDELRELLAFCPAV